MSYILDALKRAESERERGSIPGLHTQQVMPGAPGSAVAAPSRPYLWPAVGAGVVVLGALGLYLLAPVSLRLNVHGPQGTPPQAAAPLPAPQISTITAVADSGRAAAVAPPTESEAEPARSGRKVSAADAAEARAAARRARDDAPPVPKTPEARIYSLAELPTNIRQELPNVVVGGSSYSTNPALRMLMLNGKMYQERDQPAPNLQLEQIRQGSAVLKYKGYRYRITY